MSSRKLQMTEQYLHRATKEMRGHAGEAGRVEFRDSAFWFYGTLDAVLRLLAKYRGAKVGLGYQSATDSYYFKLETPHFEGDSSAVEAGEANAKREGRAEAEGNGLVQPVDGPMVKSVIEIERELSVRGVDGEEYLAQARELLLASGYAYTGGQCTCGGGEHGHHFACGYSLPTYFSVGANGTWTTEAAPAPFFSQRGALIRPSRRHPEETGIMSLWIDGANVGTLFPNQHQQMAYLAEKGLVTDRAGALPQRPDGARAARR